MMDIERIAYELIRKKARDYLQDVSNEDLGLYTRGVVDMQMEIASKWQSKTCEMEKNLRTIATLGKQTKEVEE